MNITKQGFWPKEGKLKKGIIILIIVVITALLMTLVEEKSDIKLTKKVPFVIALACLAVWFNQPVKKK